MLRLAKLSLLSEAGLEAEQPGRGLSWADRRQGHCKLRALRALCAQVAWRLSGLSWSTAESKSPSAGLRQAETMLRFKPPECTSSSNCLLLGLIEALVHGKFWEIFSNWRVIFPPYKVARFSYTRMNHTNKFSMSHSQTWNMYRAGRDNLYTCLFMNFAK